MVNFGLNSAALLGIFLAVAGAGLYFLRSIRPELARDQDIFFAAVGVLCGGILLTQGWRLDPILQFGQFLLTGSTVFFAFEAIRLRGIATEQANRITPIVDEERPVSRSYRYDQEAELYNYDQLEPEEERYVNRRLRGTVDPRTTERDRYEGDVRRPKSRGTSERSPGERPAAKRRPRPTGRPAEPTGDTWNAELDNSWDDRSSYRETSDPGLEGRSARSSRPRPSRTETRPERESRSENIGPKPRRRRPSSDRVSSSAAPEMETTTNEEYVDYQPIDSSRDENDKPGRFDY